MICLYYKEEQGGGERAFLSYIQPWDMTMWHAPASLTQGFLGTRAAAACSVSLHVHLPPLGVPLHSAVASRKIPGSGQPGSSTSRREKSVGMRGVSQGQRYRLRFFLTRQKGRRRCELFRLSTGTSSPFLPSSLTRLLVLLENKDDMLLERQGTVSFRAGYGRSP